MKNAIFKTVLITILAISFNACENDVNNDNESLNGDYTGIFTVEYSVGGDTFSNPVNLSFNSENNYQSSGNDNFIPAGGSGTYEKTTTTINFSDNNVWTANFDGNLILNGEYNYTINGNELIISANKNGVGFYKYELTKVE